ncbi:MAG: hypothetical protein V1797_08680 [Pseudomonadota bacterium]
MANRAQAKKLQIGRQARVRRSGLWRGVTCLMLVLIIMGLSVTDSPGATAAPPKPKPTNGPGDNDAKKDGPKGTIHIYKYVASEGTASEITSYIVYGVKTDKSSCGPAFLHFNKSNELILGMKDGKPIPALQDGKPIPALQDRKPKPAVQDRKPTPEMEKVVKDIDKVLVFVGANSCDLLTATGEKGSCGPACIKKLTEIYFKPDAPKICDVMVKFHADLQQTSDDIPRPDLANLGAHEANLNRTFATYLSTTNTTAPSSNLMTFAPDRPALTGTPDTKPDSNLAPAPPTVKPLEVITGNDGTQTNPPTRFSDEASVWLPMVAVLVGFLFAIAFLLMLSQMTSALKGLSIAPRVQPKPAVKAKFTPSKRAFDETGKPIRQIAPTIENPSAMVDTWAESARVEPLPETRVVSKQTSDHAAPGMAPVINRDSISQEIERVQSTVDETKQSAQQRYEELFTQLSGLVNKSADNSENIKQLKRDIGGWKSSVEQVQTEQARQAEELASQRQLVTGMQDDNRSLTQKAADYEAQLKQLTAALASIMSRSGLHAAEALMRDPATEAEPTRRAELESQRLAAAADISRAELVLSERSKQFQEMLRGLHLAIQKAQGMVNRLMPTLQAHGQMLALSDLLQGLEILANYQDPVMLVDSLNERARTVYRDLHDPAEAEKRTLADLLTSEEIWKTLTLVLRAPALAKVNLWQYSNDTAVFYLISQLGVARHLLVDFLAQCGVEPQSINFMETYTTDLACEVAGAAISPQYERHPEMLQEMLTNWEKAFRPQSVIYDVDVWGFARDIGASRKSLVYYLDDQRVRLMVDHMGEGV